jgi:hypothetical protein
MTAATLSFRAQLDFAEQTKVLSNELNMSSSDDVRGKNERVLKDRMVFLSKTLSARHLAENEAMDGSAGDGLA